MGYQRKLPMAPISLVERAVPLKDRRRESMWDVHAKGYENVTAVQVKLSGAFAPGAKLEGKSMPHNIAEIISVAELVPENSVGMRTLTIQSDVAGATAYLESLFQSAGLDHTLEVSGNAIVVPTPHHAAIAISLPGTYSISRPPGVVSSDGSIYASRDTKIARNLPENIRIGDLEAAGLQGVELVTAVDGRCLGAAFFRGDGSISLFDSQYFQDPKVSGPIDSMAENTNKLSPSPVTSFLRVLNAIALDASPVQQDRALRDVRQACETFGSVQDAVVLKSVVPASIVVRFSDVGACTRALHELGGREYDGRPLVCAYSVGTALAS